MHGTHALTSTADLVDVAAWKRWLLGARGRRLWQHWSRDRPALLGWGPEDLAHPVASARTDAMQAALVELAQQGHSEAATTLLVQLRPGLRALARRLAADGRCSWSEALDEVRAVFFETLCLHRLERRPTKIAANLILDTRQRLGRAQHRDHRALGPALPQSSPADTDPVARLLVTSTLRSGVQRLPGSEGSRQLTATIAFRAWVLGQPQTSIAEDLGLGPGAVSARLHRLRSLVPREELRG